MTWMMTKPRHCGSSSTASKSPVKRSILSLPRSLIYNANKSTTLLTDLALYTLVKYALVVRSSMALLTRTLQGEGDARFIVVSKRRERQPQGSNTVGLQPADDKSWRARNQEEKKKASAEPSVRILPVRQPKGPEPKGFSEVLDCTHCGASNAPSRNTELRVSLHHRPHQRPQCKLLRARPLHQSSQRLRQHFNQR